MSSVLDRHVSPPPSGPREREVIAAFGEITTEAITAGRLEDLLALVGELTTGSDLFRRRWASRDVRLHRSGRKRLHHPVVGRLDLDVETMELPADPGLHLNVYTAPAGTATGPAAATRGTN